jgi:hypothetical protein
MRKGILAFIMAVVMVGFSSARDYGRNAEFQSGTFSGRSLIYYTLKHIHLIRVQYFLIIYNFRFK